LRFNVLVVVYTGDKVFDMTKVACLQTENFL